MFSKQNTLRWVEYARSTSTFQWIGTEENEFVPPILGEPFPDIYPFKKFIVSTDAPVFTNSLGFTAQGPPNTVVNVKVAFQKGKVFDLFKVEKLINRPVIVIKLENGKYRIVKTNGAIDYTESQLEQFRVPVILNGREMVDVDPNNLSAATESTLTLQLRFNSGGGLPTPSPVFGSDNNDGMVYLMLKKRPSSNTTPPDPRYYQQIIGAEIVSFIQLKQRGAVTNGIINENHPYVKDRRRIILLDLNGIMRYRGVGSVESILATKGNFQPENYGGFIEKAVMNSATERTTQILTLVGGVDVFSEQHFNDHLFTRIL